MNFSTESSGLQPNLQWATSRSLWKYRRNNLFSSLEADHLQFFNSFSQINMKYKWPKTPLYEWSRRVEYPFVVENLRSNTTIDILDAGSGVTFLPYHLKKVYGFNVDCLDTDSSYGYIMSQILEKIGDNMHIPYYVGDISSQLPFESESYDVVISISVVEHIKPDKRLSSISELWRLVRKGGKLIVTMDVTLDNSSEGIPISELEDFLNDLSGETVLLPKLKEISRNLLTPQLPWYSLIPVKSRKKGKINFGLLSIYYDLIREPLPKLGKLACLLLSIPKPQ